MVPMRDGVRLRTEVIRPRKDGKFPVLLKRHCYWSYASAAGSQQTHRDLARRDYVVVVQYSRGTLGSEGEFRPIVVEGDDGFDAVEWAASQPWSNGKVATFGSSYLGMTQWQMARQRPPHLVAMVSTTPGGDGFSNWPYHSRGVLAVHCAAPWTLLQSQQTAVERGIPHPMRDVLPNQLEGTTGSVPAADVTGPPPAVVTDNWSEKGMAEYAAGGAFLLEALKPLLEHRPLRDAPGFRDVAPWWAEWMDNHNQTDAYWQHADLAGRHGQVAVPVLHSTGWYDLFLRNVLHDFQEMVKNASDDDVRRGQRLVVGPCDHLGASNFPFGNVYDPAGPNLAGRLGDVTFFPDEWTPFDERAGVQFVDHYVKNLDQGCDNEAPIRLFVMGENVWREEWEWPLARTAWTSYYLHSGGNANTLDGDGRLSTEPSSGAACDAYSYDPADPVPSKGGAILIGAMPADQRDNERRSDVLVYTSEPLTADLEVTGPVSVELWVSSTVADTDFTAMLVDVHPDGRAVKLCDGIVRTRYTVDDELLMEPDKVYPFTIDLVATSNVFKAGHRLRVDVTSSNCPLYDVNPNTGRHTFDAPDGRTKVAGQRVYHGSDHPSRLILPVIPT